MKKTIISLLVFIVLIALASCGKTDESPTDNSNTSKVITYSEAYNKAIETIPELLEKGNKLDLISSYKEATFEYQFDKPEMFDEAYQVIKAEAYDIDIKITIKITIEGKTETYYKNVTIKEDITYYFEKVASYIRSFIKSPIKGDLKLKTSYYSSDIKITYHSNRPDVITDSGIYLNHEYDEDVRITCNLELGDDKYSFDIDLISTGIYDSEKVEKVETWLKEYFENVNLKEGDKLPTTHPDYKGRIRWVCEDPSVVVDYTTVNLPVKGGTYRFLAEVNFASGYKIVTLDTYLNATKLTKEERTLNFIKQSLIPTEGEFINLYEGTSAIINTTKLINIDDENLVQYWTYGYKPSISQGILDNMVYPGYTLKNDKNVLWVVVHETGMANIGVNAERLANSQYENAYVGGGREASWNYTVDDGNIYQSYGDDVACWHASDGRSDKRGNLNGIGIEMCVNPDGEYNASMRNDARLIAYFLHTYKLGMLNVKQHFNFDGNGKNCPENMRNDRRWFEFMGMITREYASQELLKDVDVQYNVLSNNTNKWKLAGIYQLTNAQEVKTEVTIFDQKFVISTTNE